MLLMKVFIIKKYLMSFFSLLKWRNNFLTWVYFCFYPVFHWDNIVWKVLPKVGGLGKNVNRGMTLLGFVYRIGASSFLHSDIERLNGATLGPRITGGLKLEGVTWFERENLRLILIPCTWEESLLTPWLT